MKKVVAVILLLGASAIQAATIAIDFEEFVAGDSGSGSIATQGYTLTSSGSGTNPPDYGFRFVSGNDITYGYCPDCVASLSNSAGGSFSLVAADIYVGTTEPASITVTGYLMSGGVVQTDVAGGIGSVAGLDFQTVAFGAGWEDLERVEFGFANFDVFALGGYGLDNILVTAVPIPAAVWLFGSGLGLLGWFRRRA